MNERTKIDVSLDTFGASRQALPSHASVNLFQSSLGQSRGFCQDMDNEKQLALRNQTNQKGTGGQREDKEAELETLRNVKLFLTDKLKQNEQITCTFQQDIDILKEVLRVEKQITEKTKTQLKQKDADIKVLRAEFLESEAKLRE